MDGWRFYEECYPDGSTHRSAWQSRGTIIAHELCTDSYYAQCGPLSEVKQLSPRAVEYMDSFTRMVSVAQAWVIDPMVMDYIDDLLWERKKGIEE